MTPERRLPKARNLGHKAELGKLGQKRVHSRKQTTRMWTVAAKQRSKGSYFLSFCGTKKQPT